MSYLQCQECGRIIYSWSNREIGLACSIRDCKGLMEFKGGHYYIYSSPSQQATLDLQCRECFHICSSKVTGLKIFDRCPIRGCTGTLDRFYH